MTKIRVTSEGGHWIVSLDGAKQGSHTDLMDARRQARRLAQQAGVAEVEIDYPRTGFASMLCL
jgi:hypothetical protein